MALSATLRGSWPRETDLTTAWEEGSRLKKSNCSVWLLKANWWTSYFRNYQVMSLTSSCLKRDNGLFFISTDWHLDIIYSCAIVCYVDIHIKWIWRDKQLNQLKVFLQNWVNSVPAKIWHLKTKFLSTLTKLIQKCVKSFLEVLPIEFSFVLHMKKEHFEYVK